MAFLRKIRVMTVPPLTWPALAALALLLAALALSPSAAMVSLYYGKPLQGMTIALDPGHGGIDSGAHHESLLLEKEIVLEIGLQLRRLLEQGGARVMITREKDEELSKHCPDEGMARHRRDIRGRVKLINTSQAHLFISLHINSIHDPSVRGPIAFYAPGKPESKRLAGTVHDALNPLFSADAKAGQLVHQAPQESSAFFILNETEMPGILLEIAFITNPDDRALLQGKPFRKKIARAIYLGLAEYACGEEDP
ncbi:MAG: N-acetylmuramoyl-L-alanine amidase [Firmicutes bacterium]|nr:N-acetylmuramoyl-L-alanine amidase [Bacillota bacterium]